MSSVTTLHTLPAAAGWRVWGKMFIDAEGRKISWSGVTYGPFAPRKRADGTFDCWPEKEVLAADLRHIRQLGFDVVRIYEKPSSDLLERCEAEGLKLLVGISWTQHVDFINQPKFQRQAESIVRETARALSNESSVAAFFVGNEIEKTLVRWMGPDRVRDFLEKLIAIVHREAPGKPVSYACYPSTEYLLPRNADFVAFNVFLEHRKTFADYLQHLQNLAGNRPLVISEFGLDTKANGEAAQAEVRQWFEEECFRAGIAGRCWFSYTDEWHRGGEDVTGWEFGLVTRQREEKPACAVHFAKPAPGKSKISVVVCTHNGSATLAKCLESLRSLSVPPHEVLIIDDGSTDQVPQIAQRFPEFHYHRQDHAGLSAARNLGMHLATGDVIAYTDDDCFPDEDWILHLTLAFEDDRWVGAGGPNLSPVPRTVTEACVAAAPGSPSHVLIDDFEAEHLPGCNLVIRKQALEAIGGFREEFKTAGDDVDVCWRLQQQGWRLRFVPAAIVWHHRRFTVKAYLRQQRGYGHAEAMLIRRYPEKFAWFSGARWRGAIYGDGAGEMKLDQQHIQFGRYGLAPFQCVYATWDSSFWNLWCGLPWLLLTLLLWCSPITLPVGLLSLTMGFIAAQRRASRFDDNLKNPTLWQRTLLWTLCLTQPVARDWARLVGMVKMRAMPDRPVNWDWSRLLHRFTRKSNGPRWRSSPGDFLFWSTNGIGREQLLDQLVKTAESTPLHVQPVDGDGFWDLEIYIPNQNVTWWMASVTEYHEGQRRLTRIQLRGKGDGKMVKEFLASNARVIGLSAVTSADAGEFPTEANVIPGNISKIKA